MSAGCRYVFCVLVVACSQLNSASLHARELPGVTMPIRETDWNVADRFAWNTFRKTPVAGSLPLSGEPARRFFEAFKVNLKAGSAGEYQTILQRHAFYDAMGFTLHRVEDVPKALRCVRFFDAAADITATTNLGGAETLVGQLVAGLSEETVAAIVAVNQMLFSANVPVMRKLLLDWKEPRDPLHAVPKDKLDAMSFDLKMVRFEQQKVEEFFATNRRHRTGAVLKQLSDPNLQADVAGHYLSGQGGPTARRTKFRDEWLPAVGIKAFSFEQMGHRVAMGESYVFFLHGYGLDDFKLYREKGKIPAASCKGALP